MEGPLEISVNILAFIGLLLFGYWLLLKHRNEGQRKKREKELRN
jgi:hypothetical protein